MRDKLVPTNGPVLTGFNSVMFMGDGQLGAICRKIVYYYWLGLAECIFGLELVG